MNPKHPHGPPMTLGNTRAPGGSTKWVKVKNPPDHAALVRRRNDARDATISNGLSAVAVNSICLFCGDSIPVARMGWPREKEKGYQLQQQWLETLSAFSDLRLRNYDGGKDRHATR